MYHIDESRLDFRPNKLMMNPIENIIKLIKLIGGSPPCHVAGVIQFM